MFLSTASASSAKEELSQRLAKNDGFRANFSQQVISPEGDTVMEGEGTVEIARPNQFRWSTTFPDETLLVSDGQTLWYYSPFIEQVSIYKQEQATEQTPFILLTRNRASDWDNYKVSQQGDQFTLIPTAVDSTQGQFQINIDVKGMVKGFNVLEQDGQKGLFTFNNVKLGKPKAERFTFTVPDGVEVDDQRN
ncbi:outer membrane lipoprotein chaperone LolA [Vibrio azureus]